VMDAVQTVHRLLELEGDSVEDIASDWISNTEPRYFITSSAGFPSGMLVSYEGRIIIVRGHQDYEDTNTWLSHMLFGDQGAKVPWEQARKKLESGQTYHGWLEVEEEHVRRERRLRWLTQGPVRIGKIQR